MIQEIKKIVDELSINENLTEGGRHSWGCKNQRARLEKICELAIQNFDGDILEIGCHIGLTTRIFAQLAKKYNRKVVVVDPWNGQQEGNQSVYEAFMHNTSEYHDIIDINRVSSFSDQGKNIIKNGSFAFCWIDGLHTYYACSQDIDSCSGQNGILAVDDLRWLPELRQLFDEKTRQYDFTSYYNDNCREGYYITKNGEQQ